MHTVCFVTVLLFFLYRLGKTDPDYYWREYNGTIPEDAVEGGKTSRGNITYIGQAFVLHRGILIGEIYPGERTLITTERTVTTPKASRIHKTTLGNKILCSKHKENFVWIRVNVGNLHSKTMNKHLVPGGVEWGKILNIGRTRYQEEIVVGKVPTGVIGNEKLYFPYGGEEVSVTGYEILVYEEKSENTPVD